MSNNNSNDSLPSSRTSQQPSSSSKRKRSEESQNDNNNTSTKASSSSTTKKLKKESGDTKTTTPTKSSLDSSTATSSSSSNDYGTIISELNSRLQELSGTEITSFTRYADSLLYLVNFLSKNRNSIQEVIDQVTRQPSQAETASTNTPVIAQLDSLLQTIIKSIHQFQTPADTTTSTTTAANNTTQQQQQPAMDLEWFFHIIQFESIWKKFSNQFSERDKSCEKLKDIYRIIEKCQDVISKCSSTGESFIGLLTRIKVQKDTASTIDLQKSVQILKEKLNYQLGRLDKNSPNFESDPALLAFFLANFKNVVQTFDNSCIQFAEHSLSTQIPFIEAIFNAFAQIGKIEDPSPGLELKENYIRLRNEVHTTLDQCGNLLTQWTTLGNYSFYQWCIANSAPSMNKEDVISEANIIHLLKTTKVSFAKSLLDTTTKKCWEILQKLYHHPKYLAKYGQNQNNIPNIMLHKGSTLTNNSELDYIGERFFQMFSVSKSKSAAFMDVTTSLARSVASDMKIVAKTYDQYKNHTDTFIRSFASTAEQQLDNKIFQHFVVSLLSLHPVLIASENFFNNRLRPFVWIFSILDQRPIFKLNPELEKHCQEVVQFSQYYGQRDQVWALKKIQPQEFIRSNLRRIFVRNTDCVDVVQVHHQQQKKLYFAFEYDYQQLLLIMLASPPSLRNIKFCSTERVRIYFEIENASALMHALLLEPNHPDKLPSQDNKHRLLDILDFNLRCNVKNVKESRDLAVFLLKKESIPETSWKSSLKPFIIVKEASSPSSLSSVAITTTTTSVTIIDHLPDDVILCPVENSQLIQCGLNIHHTQYIGHYNRFLQITISQLFCFNFEHVDSNINSFSVFPALETLGKTLMSVYKELGRSRSDDISLELIRGIEAVKLSATVYVVGNIDQIFVRDRIGGLFSFKDPLNQQSYKQSLAIDTKDMPMEQIIKQIMDFVKSSTNARMFFIRAGKDSCTILGFVNNK